jgi:two-component sensor histidine kinase
MQSRTNVCGGLGRSARYELRLYLEIEQPASRRNEVILSPLRVTLARLEPAMRKLSFIPDRPAAWWKSWVLPLIAAATAWGARYLLQPILGAAAPYLFFVAAVLVATWWGGRTGGLLATILGGLGANLSFVGLPGRFELQGAELLDLLVFLLFCGGLTFAEEALISGIHREIVLNDELSLVGRELRHRMKNVLAVAEALSHQTGRYAATVEEFDRKLVGRLRALVTAQDLLAGDVKERAALGKIVDAAVTPYLTEGRLAAPFAGPELEIDRELVVPLALILNELATNAMKYGALSAPAGLLKLDWSRNGNRAVIHWVELNGPPVSPPTTEGFGTRLLRSALPRSSGAVQLVFEPAGLRCEISVAAAEPAAPGKARNAHRRALGAETF